MNIFEHLIGKEVLSILRVDFKLNYDQESPIALFLQLDTNLGLFIENGTDNLTAIRCINLNEILEEFEEEYQTCLNSLNAKDPLNNLIGGKLKAIKLGPHSPNKFESQNFVVTYSEYFEVQLEIGDLQIKIFQKDSRQIFTIIYTSTH